MRIFLSCQQALKPQPVPAYAFWEHYFKSAIDEGGHEAIETPGIDWAEGLTRLSAEDRARWLESTWTKTVDYIRIEHARKPIDIFLGYLFPDQIAPSAVLAIRGLGVPTVNFFCDNMREFTSVPATFKNFDLHWVPEAEARPMYASARLPFIYAPMPMWVRPDLRTTPTTEIEGAVFIGSRDDLREDLLGEAVGKGLDLTVRGAGWENPSGEPDEGSRQAAGTIHNQLMFLRNHGLRGFLMKGTYKYRRRRSADWIESHSAPSPTAVEYSQLIRQAEISIGVNRCPSFRRSFSNPLKYSRLRDIEAPMLGSCYLTELAPGLSDLYDLGAEIETYSSASELADKASMLRSDAQKRLRLRIAGQRRALADHSIERTLARIAETLSIST
jgi:hypothetical protein